MEFTRDVRSLVDDAKGQDIRLPNFFIVGAAKAGTTSMWRYLVQHPNVFMPPNFLHKEPGFFSELYGYDSWERYSALFSDVEEQHNAIGEASTAYLTDPVSAERIAAAVPQAKIIIMLRNPVDRAYSLYNWMAQEGYEYATSFESALELEDRRFCDRRFHHNNPQYYYNYLYLRSGQYYEQVRRYIDTFPRDQILILIFERFVREPLQVYRNVCEFLGVRTDFRPEIDAHNVSRTTMYPPLQFALRKANKLLNRLFHRRPATKEERDLLLALGLLARRPPKLDDKLRSQLLERYRCDVEKLECLIQEDLSLWFTKG